MANELCINKTGIKKRAQPGQGGGKPRKKEWHQQSQRCETAHRMKEAWGAGRRQGQTCHGCARAKTEQVPPAGLWKALEERAGQEG